MKQRFLSLCGVIAPLVFVFMTFLGGALRPGYSHISDTVSELFSPGSPNKFLLDTLHVTFALLLALFGVGVLQFVRASKKPTPLGLTGASMLIAMGIVSLTTATVFPQDAWGSPATFPGRMHLIMSGVVGFLSILAMLLLGVWFKQTTINPGFGSYSFTTAGASILLAGFFLSQVGGPTMGLSERIAILVGFLWTVSLGLWTFSRGGYEGG